LNQITIKNDSIELTVLDFGAIIQKLIVKDKNKEPINVVIGFDNPDDYILDDMFLGACIGRYAGRIANGEFSLEGKDYKLHDDDGVHLHGGKEGFNRKYFTVEEVNESTEPFVKLSYLSVDMEEGYPGNVKITVTYRLKGNSLIITHEATTDKTTVINLTNHSYFKFDNEKEVDGYDLKLNCSKITETHDNLLPTGTLLPVDNTKYDFRVKKQLKDTRLDTPFAIDKNANVAAIVHSPISGVTMSVATNQPALIIYTPNKTGSICFETQNFPDAPNQNNFPSCKLKPGSVYKNETYFTFS